MLLLEKPIFELAALFDATNADILDGVLRRLPAVVRVGFQQQYLFWKFVSERCCFAALRNTILYSQSFELSRNGVLETSPASRCAPPSEPAAKRALCHERVLLKQSSELYQGGLLSPVDFLEHNKV